MIKDEYCLVWEDSFDREGSRILKNGTAWYPAEGSETMNFSFIQQDRKTCVWREENSGSPHGNRSVTGMPILPAKLTTAGKADWQYGKVQVRAKAAQREGVLACYLDDAQ